MRPTPLLTLQLGRDTGLTSEFGRCERADRKRRRAGLHLFRNERNYDPRCRTAASSTRPATATCATVREPEPPRRAARDGIVRVAREKSGRRGKTVTVVRGLPPGDVAEAASDLKRHCGSGGTVKDGNVELQGDHREKAAARLRARGYQVKLAGG